MDIADLTYATVCLLSGAIKKDSDVELCACVAAAAPEAAGQKSKDRGNAAFKAGDYAGAIAAYSEAIRDDVRNPVYYSNRAMAALKVALPPQHIHDLLIACRSCAASHVCISQCVAYRLPTCCGRNTVVIQRCILAPISSVAWSAGSM